jgi:glycosyltransferase involved in cell wall biosynthesis
MRTAPTHESPPSWRRDRPLGTPPIEVYRGPPPAPSNKDHSDRGASPARRFIHCMAGSHCMLPKPLSPLPEDQLTRGWPTRSEPVVSVVCATYNHAPFIRDALDGFLAQETDFPFEVVVRDDASTDGTADIVREYAARYPKVIRAILEPANTFGKGRSPLTEMLRHARGEFIANCEGDDYWTHHRKLAIQVAALRERPASALCFHPVHVLRQDSGVTWSGPPTAVPPSASPDQLALPVGWFPMPVSWVYRRDTCDFMAHELGAVLNADNMLLSQFGRRGGGIGVAEAMGVYRLHQNSTYSSKTERQQRLARLNSYLWISSYHFRTGSPRLGRRFSEAAAFLAEQELSAFSRPVAIWSTVMLLGVLVRTKLKFRAQVKRLLGRTKRK